jgi:predicted transposase/invertase (TIGR01784 family)
MKEGIRAGKEAGLQEGLQEGMKTGIREVAENMLSLNLDLATISKATGLTEQEIADLKK